MALDFYVTIEGTRTSFIGDGSVAETNKILCKEFFYEITSPANPTAQTSGKLSYKPITITKEWGLASPQIFQALIDNETLTSVLFEFKRKTQQGAEEIFHKIRLTMARIVAVRQYIGNVETFVLDSTTNYAALENVSFQYRMIEMISVAKEKRTNAIHDTVGP